MTKISSGKRVLIGASYSLDPVGPKSSVLEVLAQHGFLPFEIGMMPDANKFYWDTIEAALKSAEYYLLILPKANILSGKPFELLEKEISIIKRGGRPIIVLVHDEEELKQKLGITYLNTALKRNIDIFDLKRDCPQLIIEFWTRENINEAIENAIKSISPNYTNQTSHPVLIDPTEDSYYKQRVSFIAYYYSSVYEEVKSCSIEIGLFKTKYKKDDAYPARQKGFHDGHKNAFYVGFAYSRSGFLHIDLDKYPDMHDTLNFRVYIGNSGIENLPALDIMIGSIQGLTSTITSRNCCYKTILLRKSKKLQKSAIKHIKKLLYFSKKSFLTNPVKLPFRESQKLSSGHLAVGDIQHVSGSYRIWTGGFLQEGKIVQSKMSIGENYHGTVQNPIFRDATGRIYEQIVDLRFSDLNEAGSGKLILIMRTKEEKNSQITSIAILEIPSEKSLAEILVGSFCSIGQLHGEKQKKRLPTSARGGYFVALKDDREINPGFIDPQKFEEYQADYSAMLDELWKYCGKPPTKNRRVQIQP